MLKKRRRLVNRSKDIRCSRCEWLFGNGEPDSKRCDGKTHCARCEEELHKK